MGGAVGTPARIIGLDDTLVVETDSLADSFETGDGEQLVVDTGDVLDRNQSVRTDDSRSMFYYNYLTEQWVEETQMTLAVFTTPAASVGDRSLNPLSAVDEASFVSEEGGRYLEELGLLEEAGLGPDLSWLVVPERLRSTDISFLGESTPLSSYLGIVEGDDDAAPRTLLVHLAKLETGDDIAFGVGIQHRGLWVNGDDGMGEVVRTDIQSYSVSDLVGPDGVVREAGIAASAERAADALGNISLS